MLDKFFVRFILFIMILILLVLISERKNKEAPVFYQDGLSIQDNYLEEEYLIYVADQNNLIFPLNVVALFDKDFKISYYHSETNNEIDKEIYMVFSLLTNYSNHLPQGTKTFIPKTTKLLDYNISEDILILNLSEDFLTYNQKYEEEILKILTFSFTSIPGINKVKLVCEGENINFKTYYKNILSKDEFILNMFINDVISDNLLKYEVYYLTQVEDSLYLVKVTVFDNDIPSKEEKINKLLTTVGMIPVITLVTEESIGEINKSVIFEENLSFYQYYLTCFDNNIKEQNNSYDIKDINYYYTIFR